MLRFAPPKWGNEVTQFGQTHILYVDSEDHDHAAVGYRYTIFAYYIFAAVALQALFKPKLGQQNSGHQHAILATRRKSWSFLQPE